MIGHLLHRLWAAPALLQVVAMLCWSGNFVLGRAMHEHIPPIGLSFWRWSIAFALVLGFAWPHLRRDLPVLWKNRGLIALLAFLGVATFQALVYYGLNTTTVVNAVLMQSTMPVLIILGSWLVFREPVRWLQMMAVAISLAGVAVIITRGSLRALLELSLTPGDGLVMVAVFCYAFYSVLLRRRPTVHPLSFLAATFAIGSLMLVPVYLHEHVYLRPMHFDGQTLAALAFVAVFPSLVAYMCFNRAVELIGANRAGQFLHLMPVFGSALAALFLGETLRTSHLVGAALIATGIGLAQVAKKG
ncbi:MAG: DMT family transporter [Panacagrimonas sp.]